jgi:hypothetical protein
VVTFISINSIEVKDIHTGCNLVIYLEEAKVDLVTWIGCHCIFVISILTNLLSKGGVSLAKDSRSSWRS